MKPHVTCIVLNYNHWEMTQECIASLEKSTFKVFNIVFTDNHSNHNQSNRLYKLNDPEDLTDKLYKLINDKNKQNPNINNTNGRLRNKSNEYRMMKQLQNHYEYYKT